MKDDDEAITTHYRIAQRDGKSDSPRCNLSADARRIVGIEIGDEVGLHVYDEMIVITPAEEGSE